MGLNNYKWILYGDDDTVFFPQNVLDLVNSLDHEMPYYLTDHLWFPEWKGEHVQRCSVLSCACVDLSKVRICIMLPCVRLISSRS